MLLYCVFGIKRINKSLYLYVELGSCRGLFKGVWPNILREDLEIYILIRPYDVIFEKYKYSDTSANEDNSFRNHIR
jgi:hypothetical protein